MMGLLEGDVMTNEKDCTAALDELRDSIGPDMVNHEQWILLITAMRRMCRSQGRIEEAIFDGDGNGNKGILDMLTQMNENQQKRSDDKFSWKRMFQRQILPQIILMILTAAIAGAFGWWLAVNEHINTIEGGGALVLHLLTVLLHI